MTKALLQNYIEGKNAETENDSRVDGEEESMADRHMHHPHPTRTEVDDAQSEHLSGESDRIGTGNLDENIPFGTHEGYV
jgi:hypothetical protein